MTFQNAVWTIALTGMGLVSLGFLYVVAKAGQKADPDGVRDIGQRSNHWRRMLFFLLLVGFFVGSYATLHQFPIPPQSGELAASQVVDVSGRQWSWEMTLQGQAAGGAPLVLKTGAPVEFRVTSSDVNHGFAIYAPNGRIAIQTQAMPGFTNKILHTFTEPGTYRVMCLEYCGVGHAPMVAEFEVNNANGG